MSKRTRRTAARDFPRTVRLNQLVQEIVADEIERFDDDRLGLLTVVAVDVEPDLRHATVWYSALAAGDEADLVTALGEHRARLQSAVARQARMKRTPELSFKADDVTRQAERVEQILRDLHPDT
jgi:ribosome-binding factor A